MSPTEPSSALQAWLHEHQLAGSLCVLAMHAWADVEATLKTINVEEITAEKITAYLDFPDGGIKEVEVLRSERIAAYYGKYSTRSKTYKTLGG